MKRKVCVVVTARPSYSRIKTALRAISDHPDLELQLVVGGSALLARYGDTIESIRRDSFEIAARVFIVVEGENPITSAKSTGLGRSLVSCTIAELLFAFLARARHQVLDALPA